MGCTAGLVHTQCTVQVLYECSADGTVTVRDFREVSTCVYEVVIVTPVVCAHPAFKVRPFPLRCLVTREHTLGGTATMHVRVCVLPPSRPPFDVPLRCGPSLWRWRTWLGKRKTSSAGWMCEGGVWSAEVPCEMHPQVASVVVWPARVCCWGLSSSHHHKHLTGSCSEDHTRGVNEQCTTIRGHTHTTYPHRTNFKILPVTRSTSSSWCGMCAPPPHPSSRIAADSLACRVCAVGGAVGMSCPAPHSGVHLWPGGWGRRSGS
jgi:hypothetical protein